MTSLTGVLTKRFKMQFRDQNEFESTERHPGYYPISYDAAFVFVGGAHWVECLAERNGTPRTDRHRVHKPFVRQQ